MCFGKTVNRTVFNSSQFSKTVKNSRLTVLDGSVTVNCHLKYISFVIMQNTCSKVKTIKKPTGASFLSSSSFVFPLSFFVSTIRAQKLKEV